MATEAEATREARARVVTSQGEKNASMALKEAADTIAKSPVALQLRFLQTLTHIAAEQNSTIIFPIPIELLRNFSNRSSSKQSETTKNRNESHR
jgi:erythrocyte band 7 integral membrane protein